MTRQQHDRSYDHADLEIIEPGDVDALLAQDQQPQTVASEPTVVRFRTKVTTKHRSRQEPVLNGDRRMLDTSQGRGHYHGPSEYC